MFRKGAVAVIAVGLAVALAGCGGSSASSSSTTSSPQAASGQSFSGNGTQNLGTIRVSHPSKLEWTCHGCSSFAVVSEPSNTNNAITIVSTFGSGSSVVDPGNYPATDVVAVGSWTIHIVPAG